MDKRFWAIIGVIVVIFGGILVVHNHKSNSTDSKSNSSQATNHIEGNPNSKVTLVEYGDYECPVCETYYSVTKQVHQKYADTVKFQFRNLPLSQIHPNAFAAARAVEAADLQGKFWQMHDALYDPSNWQDWSGSSNPVPFFDAYAKQLNLNAAQFNHDFASSTVNDRINADITAFQKTGKGEATPSFFLDGKYIDNQKLVDSATGQPSVDAFSKLIDAELKKVQ